MSSRLDVMRARVEPEFLFGALADVRELYGKDRAVAEAMVDALITYLRAALPQMRGQGSTVRREIELATAYAAVLQVPRGEALTLSHGIAEGLDDIALSPMVLLPITQAAFEGEAGGVRTRYAIDAVEARRRHRHHARGGRRHATAGMERKRPRCRAPHARGVLRGHGAPRLRQRRLAPLGARFARAGSVAGGAARDGQRLSSDSMRATSSRDCGSTSLT